MLGIGAIVRRSAGAILVGVGVFACASPCRDGFAPMDRVAPQPGRYRVTPAAGFSILGLLPRSGLVSYPYTMSNGYYPLPPWVGLLVLFAYAAAALCAARFVLGRRDA